MKYYGIKSKSTYEKISFSIEKSKYFFYRNQPFSKKLRRKSQFDYDLYFNSKHFYIQDCSIPASKYCTPFCLICSDLISIENIESVKSGLKRLILHHLSNDYLTGSIDDEINKLDSLARKTPPSFSSIKIGRYSFASTETLHQKISYFTVYFKSVSSTIHLLMLLFTKPCHLFQKMLVQKNHQTFFIIQMKSLKVITSTRNFVL